MDPQATLEEMFRCVRDGNIDDAQERLDSLVTWCAVGGFVPDLQKALNCFEARP